MLRLVKSIGLLLSWIYCKWFLKNMPTLTPIFPIVLVRETSGLIHALQVIIIIFLN